MNIKELASEYSVSVDAIEQAYFVESNQPYLPKIKKIELVKEGAIVNEEEATRALKAIWEKVFISA